MINEILSSQLEKEIENLDMGFVGNIQVLQNLLNKARNPDNPNIKTALVLPGGAQRGVIQGGISLALKNLGVTNSIDHCICVSVGAVSAYYTLADDPVGGTSITWDDNVKNEVFKLSRFPNMMDVRRFEKILRETKAIDPNKFQESRSSLFVGITDEETGEGHFIDIKGVPNPEDYIMGSVCHPVYNGNDSQEIDGRNYIDGALSNPLPISFAIEQGATDILVAMTSGLTKKSAPSSTKLNIEASAYRALGLSKGSRKALRNYQEAYNSELEYLLGERALPEGVRLAAIYPTSNKIKKHTTDENLLRDAAFQSCAFTIKLFTEEVDWSNQEG